MTAENRYDSLYQYYSGLYSGLDWMFIKAQGKQESGFDPDARSAVHAKGLAQFMDATWEEWRDGTPGIQPLPENVNLVSMSPDNPEAAIKAQAAMMANLLTHYDGSKEFALAAYNWGCGRVDRLKQDSTQDFDQLRWKMPTETQDYVTRVMGFYSDYLSQEQA